MPGPRRFIPEHSPFWGIFTAYRVLKVRRGNRWHFVGIAPMDFDKIAHSRDRFSFGEAVWLFPLVFAPTPFFNNFFHAGLRAVSGDYCPGLLTALVLYLPLLVPSAGWLFGRGCCLNEGSTPAGLTIAEVFHTAEVGHNVYKTW